MYTFDAEAFLAFQCTYLIFRLYLAFDVGHRSFPAVDFAIVVAAVRDVVVRAVVLSEGGDLVIISGVVILQPGREAEHGGWGLS